MKHVTHAAILTMALLTWAGPHPAVQGADTSTEKEIREMMEKYRTALLKRDAPTLEKIWSDDYMFTNGVGETVSKAQRLANLKSGATSLGSINADQDTKVRVYGNAAVTTSRVTIEGQYSGKQASGQYRSILVWIKGGFGWQLVANQLTPLAAER